MGLPINFETKLKEAKAINGGYPYSIKAADLMRNFAWCDLLPSEAAGTLRVELVETTSEWVQRRIVISGFPSSASQGDILYFSAAANAWVVLAAPSGSALHVLTHNGTTPSWTATEEC